jgi:predicted Zn-dependent protease
MACLFPRWSLTSLLRVMVSAFTLICMTVQPVLAQGILRDAETEELLDIMSAPLITAAGLNPHNVKVTMLQDKSINAFVAGGQIVYIHSGLLLSAANANEVQGVIAHELGHVAGGHVITSSDSIRAATGISILSLVVAAAAMAAGSADLGMALLSAGQSAALGKYLAFSRTQESSADLAGAKYLAAAGVSGRGSLAFFKRLQNLEFRYSIPQTDSFDRTHPLSGERITVLQEKYEADPAWNAKTDPAIEARFQRVKAKLEGYIDPKKALVDYPMTDGSIPAHYARAYAWHRSAYPELALSDADSLIASAPRDPYFQELKGQILLESGKPLEALPLLREAVRSTNAQPLIATTFGHALIATDDSANFKEAEQVLKASVNRDNDNPFAWNQLGVVYENRGDGPRAAMAAAESNYLLGRPREALASAKMAMGGLPKDSPDWIRAQDIAMVSETAMQDKKQRRR